MEFHLPKLPLELETLSNWLSKESFDFHYNRHHKSYIGTLNTLIHKDEKMKSLNLEEILLLSSTGTLFNNAAQTWNHSFFWLSLYLNFYLNKI